MSNNYTPSINIIRDADKKVNYIPTSNSRNIYHQIASNFKSGLHSFNIIGSYGTGKSAFLLAFQKHLSGVESIFSPINGQFNGCKKFKVFNVVGESNSLIDALAKIFETNNDENDVLKFIRNENKKLKTKNTCLVLLIDEFGKFLEYAAKHNPERELYFVQRLAEYANDSRRNILFVSTLHQNFDAYAIGLSDVQRKEWEKVKGRLKELSFNEPVEQLLQLAADFISIRGFTSIKKHSPKLLALINKTGVFNLLNNVDKAFVEKLFPFDILSAMTLTLSLQRYGQNERSLFNFLQTDEFLGLNSFNELRETNPFYNLDCVYNYLQYNYYSVLTSKYNPDYFKWSMIRNSLDRVELELSDNVIEAQKLIKTIGLLDILGSNAAKINHELLEEYATVCLGIKNTPKLISLLEDKKIIRYQSFKARYKLFEGTDINIEEIQQTAQKEVDSITNIVAELKNYSQLTFEPAKAVTFQKGTPRIFQYILSETPLTEFNLNDKHREVDGIINLVFSENEEAISFDTIDEPILYGWFTNTSSIKEHLFEIKVLDKAITLINEDSVATNEIKELKKHLLDTLNTMLNKELFGAASSIRWFFDNKEINLSSKRKFNNFLSTIINSIYTKTPIFKNELINKTKISGSIKKKEFIIALIDNHNKINLGLPDGKMPPEKTNYYTLLKKTGLHIDNSIYAEFSEPNQNSSFLPLWNASKAFLESTRVSKRSLVDFINLLSAKPFKLKEGFVEFWLITFLFINREDFALFKNGIYVSRISKEIAELFYRDANKFEIKAFDIQGVKLDLFNKYRELTKQKREETIKSTSFQETAKPFLVFYGQLPKYAQQTKSLSHDTIAFRKVIRNAKELERTFFEDLPTCFGYTLEGLSSSSEELDSFINRINASIAELRSSESDLLNKIESDILETLGLQNVPFEKYKTQIQKRYASIKVHLLNQRQKSFFSRINSALPDRKAWLNSLVQSLIGKQFNAITDSEVRIIHNRFSETFKELDNLLELSQIQYNEVTQEVFKVEITSTNQAVISENIILSKNRNQEVSNLEVVLKAALETKKDNQVKQAVLIKLLKEIIENDQS